MSESANYPGLCKPYEVEQNVGQEYGQVGSNSISAPQNPSTYYTYKTYNSEYDNQRMVGTSSATRNNVQSRFANPNYNSNANNEVHSYPKRQEAKSTTNQQQYSNQRSPPSPVQQPNRYPMSPFQQAYAAYQQQNQKRRPVDKTSPYQTYRWNELFNKNNL